jgi:integrase
MGYTIYKNDASIWCINFTDPVSGKRIRKSLKTRKKAEALHRASDYWERVLIETQKKTRFETYASVFYQPGCPWTERRNKFGRPLKPQTLSKYRWNLENLIIPYFAGMSIEEITDKTVTDFALSLNYDGTTKNDIVGLVKHIIDEAVLDGIRSHGVTVMRFPKTRSKQSAITSATIHKLWPDDMDALYNVWNRPQMRDKAAPWAYATLCAIMLSGGLRSGEARALTRHHIELHNSYGIIYVEQAFDSLGVIGNLKGDRGEGKARVALIPQKTVRLLEHYLNYASDHEYLFTESETPITKDRITQRLRRVVSENDIQERLTPHTLRFTYKSITRALLDEITGELLMGHSDRSMSEWYDRPVLKERASQFIRMGVPEKIQEVWRIP